MSAAIGFVAFLGGQQSIFAPRGPAASRLAYLGGSVLITFGIITAIMYALIIWIALRRRGTLEEHQASDEGGESWIVVGGFAIPTVVLAVFFVSALRSMSAFPLHDGHADHQPDIIVTAQQWWWRAEYVSAAMCGPAGTAGWTLPSRMTTANELHIPVGVPVDIELQSNDVIHSFWVPQLHGKVDVVPGQKNRIRLIATRPGRYRGQCSEFCGEQHAHMAFFITADRASDFNGWVQAQRSTAAEPENAEQMRGKELFETKACVLCHTIRGTQAQATFGPDLTHIGSRATIASASYPNNDAYLSAWVTHAQSLKKGAQMPDLTVFTGPELRALVAYLRHLR